MESHYCRFQKKKYKISKKYSGNGQQKEERGGTNGNAENSFENFGLNSDKLITEVGFVNLIENR